MSTCFHCLNNTASIRVNPESAIPYLRADIFAHWLFYFLEASWVARHWLVNNIFYIHMVIMNLIFQPSRLHTTVWFYFFFVQICFKTFHCLFHREGILPSVIWPPVQALWIELPPTLSEKVRLKIFWPLPKSMKWLIAFGTLTSDQSPLRDTYANIVCK